MKVCLLHRQLAAAGIMTFTFKPEKKLVWQAGQSMRFELMTAVGLEERWFTLSSAPYEGTVAITTRITDSRFKQALAALRPGDYIDASTVSGDFIWRDEGGKKLFIALGIGVTPFVAIIKQRVHNCLPLPAALVYFHGTNSRLFSEELIAAQTACSELSVAYSSKRTNIETISAAVPDFRSRLAYVAGPEAAVWQLGDQLKAAGLEPSKLIQDWFAGYKSAAL